MTNDNNFAMMSSQEGTEMNETFTALRKSTGLSQRDFAESIGMKQPYIAKIENGVIDLGNVSLKNGYILSTALGCKMEDLVENKAQVVRDAKLEAMRAVARRLEAQSKKVQRKVQ